MARQVLGFAHRGGMADAPENSLEAFSGALAAGVCGSLVGGLLLGVGMNLIVGGAPVGWLLLLPAAPMGGLPGWLLAKRLARTLGQGAP